MFTRHSYRRTPSSIYLLFLSICGFIYLPWSTVPIIYALDHIDPQTQSIVICKTRLYITHTLGVFIRYCLVFASADRFFVTRPNVRIRSLSSVPLAIKLIVIMCIIGSLIAIHLPILMNIKDGVCGMFGIYTLIYAIYQTVVIVIIPPVLMSTFSFLTIRSLQERHHDAQVRTRQRDRYLTRMVTAEVIASIIISAPYSANLIYTAFTYNIVNKSPQRVEIESFIAFFSIFFLYLISVVPFYLYILTSKTFRKEFINLFVNFWYKYIIRRVRIVPHNDLITIAPNNGQTIRVRQ
ncbi:unnamed protein product [Adineta steineri]|uniref:G-protein coupled receptors family 1 profile domain-containing protein n=1 Tax=Adineta steineri TaxID=433720 RepID=A0A815JVS8_9BILA|nr:unnamed protein product [Adineta steineri]CAF3935087.1 unnamed protein product [Adineta steineri]